MQFISYMSPGFPESLFETLAREIGAEVHFERTRSGPGPDEDPFRDATFDLGWVCSTSFVDLALRHDTPSVRLAGIAWVPDDADAHGRPVYFGDIVVRPEADIHEFAHLAGRRIGCNDRVSLSGHHALRFAIEDTGEDPDRFAELVFTGGHHRSLDALVGGDVDACIVDSVVRIGRARHDPAVAGLRLLDRLGPWPVQPLVARADLPDGIVDRVQQQLLAANDRPEVVEQLHAAALTRLVAVGPEHYEPVRAAMLRPRPNR